MVIAMDDVRSKKNKTPLVLAKQVSDFNVMKLKFSSFENDRLVSCGRENIRFWRIKTGHLPGCAVVLEAHARNTHFTTLDFEHLGEQ